MLSWLVEGVELLKPGILSDYSSIHYHDQFYSLPKYNMRLSHVRAIIEKSLWHLRPFPIQSLNFVHNLPSSLLHYSFHFSDSNLNEAPVSHEWYATQLVRRQGLLSLLA